MPAWHVASSPALGTASPADVEVSLVSPDAILPSDAPSDALLPPDAPPDALLPHDALSLPANVSQSSSPDGRLKDSSNQLPAPVHDASLIKAGFGGSDMALTGTENASQPVGVYPPYSSTLTAAPGQCMTAGGDWTDAKSIGTDSEYASNLGSKQGLVMGQSEAPQKGLPQQVQGQPQAALPSCLLPESSTSTVAKPQPEQLTLLLNKKLPALKVPLTGMGRPRVAGRVAVPHFVAEGSQPSLDSPTHRQLVLDSCVECALTLDSYMQDQPDEIQEEEAARALHQHLSATSSWPNHIRPARPHQASSCMVACLGLDTAQHAQHGTAQHAPRGTAQHAQRGSRLGGSLTPGPIAEGKETESIAAFHPSWHLRLNQTARSQTQPEQRARSEAEEDSTSLDQFFRPTAGTAKAPQHQPSMVKEAGCLNFGSHLVPSEQLPETLPLRQKNHGRQRSAIDDAALSSEEEGSEYEDETPSQPLSTAESGADHLRFNRDSDGPWDNNAEGVADDALEGQEPYEPGQYADYRSEEGLSEEGQYPEGQIDRAGLDQSLEVLPAGITANTEVYSPMSHGATRVTSMITNRPFLLEEPVSPVARRLGDTMRQGSQVTFTNQAMLDDSTVMHNPSPNSHPNSNPSPNPVPASQEEPLYHDWTQPSASFLAAASAEAAAAAEAEAAAAAEAEAEAQQAAVRKPLSDPNTVKAPKVGAMTRLTDSLFRRSGKRSIETQTIMYQEEETQTADPSEVQAMAQQMMTATGTACFLLKCHNACSHALVLNVVTLLCACKYYKVTDGLNGCSTGLWQVG